MALSIADQYYAKALDLYPYELGEALETLNYALSYDDSHSGAHCLLGKVYQYDLLDLDQAIHHYTQALIANPNYTCAYSNLITLYINDRNFVKAENIINHCYSKSLIGICNLMREEAKILELLGEFKVARKVLTQAKQYSIYNDERDSIDECIKRIEDKIRFEKFKQNGNSKKPKGKGVVSKK